MPMVHGELSVSAGGKSRRGVGVGPALRVPQMTTLNVLPFARPVGFSLEFHTFTTETAS